MRLAYADPPYIGQAKKHYSEHPDYKGEVDHETLIAKLSTRYDGWALSCHVNSLAILLPMCPSGTRVGAWVKPFAFFKKGVKPNYAWEPVLFVCSRTDSQRKKVFESVKVPLSRDWYSGNVWGVTAAERAESDVKGRKRDEFCFWIFNLLGAHPSDNFFDLFPGSGAVGHAWSTWRENLR